MQYAASNTIFQADDDEDDNDDDDKKRRLIGDILLEYLFDEEHLDESPGIERRLTNLWGDSQESGVASKASEGRSIVPQFPGEPLFYTPPTYWLQVLGRALVAGGFM